MNVRKIVWVKREEGLPTEKDADAYGCVMAWHKYNGVMVTGWRRVVENEFIVAWAHTPMGPEGEEK